MPLPGIPKNIFFTLNMFMLLEIKTNYFVNLPPPSVVQYTVAVRNVTVSEKFSCTCGCVSLSCFVYSVNVRNSVSGFRMCLFIVPGLCFKWNSIRECFLYRTRPS